MPKEMHLEDLLTVADQIGHAGLVLALQDAPAETLPEVRLELAERALLARLVADAPLLAAGLAPSA